jgi:hypothetical protein
MSFSGKVSAKELTCWRLARAVIPLAVLVATIGLGQMLHAWPGDWLATTSGPLTNVFTFGLGVFPGAAFIILFSAFNWRRAVAAKSWPVTTGRVVASETTLLYAPAPIVRFRYTVDGEEYESDKIQFGRLSSWTEETARRVATRYPAGAHVRVHYDPDDPDTAVLELAHDAARRGVWMGAALFVLPFVLAWPFVWINNL